VTRFLWQPRWLAWHLLLVAVLVSFVWLGDWQLGSFEDKGDRVPPDTRPVVALDRLSKPGGRLAPEDIGRRVRTNGRYDGQHTLLVPNRPQPGSDTNGRPGLLVVTPLRTSSGVLPVVRGWVPSANAPTVAAPDGPVTLTGLLQRSESGPPSGASPVVRPGRLAYVATVTLIDALPYHPSQMYDGYLALRSEGPPPRARPTPVAAQDIDTGGVARWRNLAYALQWWLFAGAAVFFWWLVIRRAVTDRRQPPPGPEADPHALAAPRRTT
jgi:cytochrome oxidase assembly protein ShyY1